MSYITNNEKLETTWSVFGALLFYVYDDNEEKVGITKEQADAFLEIINPLINMDTSLPPEFKEIGNKVIAFFKDHDKFK